MRHDRAYGHAVTLPGRAMIALSYSYSPAKKFQVKMKVNGDFPFG